MHLWATLTFVALAASVVLLAVHPSRAIPGVAVLASGLEVLMTFQVVRVAVAHLPIGLALGAVLLGAGGFLITKVSAKPCVGAATVIALVGALQVARALHFVV